MKKTCVASGFDDLRQAADLLFLSAVLGLSIPVARAQSSVSVKVETYHGAVISGAKVTATKRRGPPPSDKEIIEVLDL